MAGAEAGVDIGSVGTIVVAAMATTQMVNGLAGEALGGKSRPGDDHLAMLVAISGVRSLVARHLLRRF